MINLLSFDIQLALSFEDQNLKISKISCVYDKLFVGIDKTGILVYNLPDLKKIKGRISVDGDIKQL